MVEPGPSGGRAWTVADLADALGGTVEGAGARALTGVRGLADAGPEHLSFLANRRYAARLATTRAGCVLVGPGVRVEAGLTVIRLADPYAGFARAVGLFHPQAWPVPGVDPRACVHETAVVDGVSVEAFAWIGPGAVVGPGSWVQAGAVVGAGAVLGRDCRLMPHSVVMDGCVLGARCWLNPGAVVGAEGFGFAPTAAGHVKIPQVGRAVLGDDVELGANTCVDRAALGETRVGDGTKADNLVQVGHAAQVGRHGLMVAFSGVAGSAVVGDGVALAARGTVLGHLTVGDGVQVGVGGVVHGDVAAGEQVSGVPAISHRQWLRAASAFGDLPELVKEVRRLRRRVAELERARGGGGA